MEEIKPFVETKQTSVLSRHEWIWQDLEFFPVTHPLAYTCEIQAGGGESFITFLLPFIPSQKSMILWKQQPINLRIAVIV